MPPCPTVVVGLDLAWGYRARSGVAIAEFAADPPSASAAIARVASVTSDAELDALLAPRLRGPCLVAVDAPLIITNATGRRPCEAALSRAFAAQHAGTYPSNTSLPIFAGGGRAAQFARRHGLAVDATAPIGPGQRRAIEVYPHSATVAVFDLPRVLAYKARPGRSLESRRGALLRLLDLLASLDTPPAGPALTIAPAVLDELRLGIAEADTAAALRRVEDPVDAITCAYVGVLYLAGDACVIGDGQTGAIVTPVRERHRRLLGLPALVRMEPGDENPSSPSTRRSHVSY